MKATLVAVLLAALAEGAAVDGSAGPPRRHQAPKPGGKTFTINQIVNKNFKGPDGPLSYMSAYLKFAEKLPAELLSALEDDPDLRIKFGAFLQGAGQTGSVQALPAQGDSEYGIQVGIGTPPQSIPLNLDTGSSDFWVFSTETQQSTVQGQVLYYPNASSTSTLLPGETWNIKYGDGARASGNVYTDTVQIGGTYVNQQAVQVAVNVSPDIAKDNFVSGILGLANSAANTVRPTPQRTYIDNIKDQLALPLFTANLRRRAPGNYNFGYIDRSEYTGRIGYAPIDRMHPLWMVAASGYQIGNDFEHSQVISTIVDTGTSLILVPENVVASYYAGIPDLRRDPKLNMLLYPCEIPLPNFYLFIGGHRAKIPGSYINYGSVGGGYCFGGIQSSASLPFSVLGDVFLKAQFVVFDYGNARVGFANKDLQS